MRTKRDLKQSEISGLSGSASVGAEAQSPTSKVPTWMFGGPVVPLLTWLIILAVLAIQGFMIWQARQEAWNEAVRSGENLVHTISNAIDKNLTIVDLSVLGAQEALEKGDTEGLSPRQRDLLLFDRSATAEFLGSMLVLSKTGDILINSRGNAPPGVDLADRDYFRAQEISNSGTYLSRPYRSRLRDGDPSIAISRRISAPDGSFDGVVMAAVRLAYFQSLFKAVTLGPDSILSLVRTDGIMIMRTPSTDGGGNIGLVLGHSPIFERMLTSPVSFVGRATIDGRERLYIHSRVGQFPLLLSVGISTTEIYADWWQQTLVTLPLTLAFCLTLGILVRALQLGLMRTKEMEEMMKQMSLTDELTGLLNRRAFEWCFASELRNKAQDPAPLTLLIIDADNFKRINDTYGHQEGDRFLRVLARQIQRGAARPSDVAARIGGEEFAVLLPRTDDASGRRIAERIRGEVERLSLSFETGQRFGTTVSIGLVTTDSSSPVSASELLKLADEALYQAKATGRNRTVASGSGGLLVD